MWPQIVLIVAVFSTLFCAAVNCYTYQIAYPLWGVIGPTEFPGVHREYMRRLTWIITIPHIVMFFSAAALLLIRPACVSAAAAMWLFVLEALVIGVSAFVAGPIHTRLGQLGVADSTRLTLLIRISLARVILMAAACGVLFRCLLGGLIPA